MHASGITIVSYGAYGHQEGLEPQLDAIFFEASATQSFASAEARALFRQRWLGRYLAHYPGEAFLAVTKAGRLAGYLAGCLDDPTSTERFADVAYFKSFAPLIVRFPAHLHINLAPEFRGHGTGSRLIEAFVAHAAAAGSPGVHVVTGKGMRNIRFYERNGFEACAETCVDGGALVLLGRRLGPRSLAP